MQGVGGIGIAGGELAEVAAGARLGERLFGLRARRLQPLGACLLGHAHEDVRQVVFDTLGRRGFHFLEEQAHLGVAHLDLVVNLALAQPRQEDLLAQVLAPAFERHAVRFEGFAKLGERHVVVLGDALHRAVELQLVDADAGLARHLQLRLLEDQALEHLVLEHVALGRGRALPAQLPLGAVDGLVQLGQRDDFLVDDRDDAVDDSDALRRRRERQGEKKSCKKPACGHD